MYVNFFFTFLFENKAKNMEVPTTNSNKIIKRVVHLPQSSTSSKVPSIRVRSEIRTSTPGDSSLTIQKAKHHQNDFSKKVSTFFQLSENIF